MAGASPNRRVSSNSKFRSAMLFSVSGRKLRRQARSELIQTTFDMRFDRSEWRIQGLGRLRVREPRAIAKADAQPLSLRQATERFVQIDAVVRARGDGRQRALVRLRQSLAAG